MKVKELRQLLNYYDGELEFEVVYGEKRYTPTVLRKEGNSLVFSQPYNMKEVDVIEENLKNIIVANSKDN